MATYHDDDIVISGIGGRFPRCNNPQELKENLFAGIDMTSTDHGKWTTGKSNVPDKIGYMDNMDRCDSQFFGIIRKQCDSLDPITRQFLERAIEAVFDAGLSPLDLKGSNTAVIMNCAILESEMLLVHANREEAYAIMGRTRALNANRLSYFLDLKGPSFATDNFFNGGLDAIQDAYNYIKNGIVDAAIVGSGSTIMYANSSYQYDKLNVLSPDGNTRSFDINGNGYGRSEAVSVLLIQRARDAKRCHATILHVLDRHYSNNEQLYNEPSLECWKKLYENFYSGCEINPKDIAYLEADGNAIPDVEATELNAVDEFFCKDRSPENPLLIGSIKSNIGHSEGASNMCAIAKLVIALTADKIPKNLNYNSPNPKIKALIKRTMKVVDEETPLNGDLVAMNSFGFNSCYGHLVLRKNLRKKQPIEIKEGSLPQIIFASSRTEEGINKVLDKVEAETLDPEYANLVNSAFNRVLSGHVYRGFTVVPPQDPPIRSNCHFDGHKHPVWFIYSGMGSQWPTAARDFMQLPVFRKSIDISAKLLSKHGVDLIHIITHDDPALFDNIINCFVCIVAIQIALTDVLKSMKIVPDGVIGHSVGETAAAYADGCLTQEQTLLCAYFRGRASLDVKVINGMMAAVGLGYQEMKNRLPDGIEIACHNGPDSCTLTGPTDQVLDYVEKLKAEGIFARAVSAGNIPYHSKYIQEVGPRMSNYLKDIIPSIPRSPRWISTSYPESQWNEPSAKISNAEYHTHNLLSPVLFEEGSRLIPENAITIEIAPHGLLQAILKRSLPSCKNIALSNRNVKNQQHVLLKAIGTMYLHGMNPCVENLYPEVAYPVSRGTNFLSPLVTWNHSEVWSNFSHSGTLENECFATINLKLDQENSICRSYEKDGVSVIPHTVCLMEIWKIYARFQGVDLDESRVEFKDVHFLNKDQLINHEKDLPLFLCIQPGRGNFEIIRLNADNPEIISNGNIKLIEKLPSADKMELIAQNELSKEEFYSELLQSGHYYDDRLQAVTKLTTGDNGWVAKVNWNNDVMRLLEAMLQVRTLQESGKPNRIHRIRKIRQLTIDTSDLSAGEVDVKLSFAPDVIRCGKVEIRDVIFESVPCSSIKFKDEEININALSLMNETIKIDYLQYNGPNVEGVQVAFVGSDSNKNKIMGIGEVKEDFVKEDPILKWQIPSGWSTEDAVSIPFNYGLAYYVVHAVGEITQQQKVAVTDGANKLGLACLRVLLEITSGVITVVSNNDEKQQLKALLPKLADENIVINPNPAGHHVTLKIKSRCPEGVDVIINTGGPDVIDSILLCLSSFGKVIELNDAKFNSLKKLTNTCAFNISASLYNSSGNELYTSPDDVKKQVHQLLLNGLASGVVKAFKESSIKDWRQTQTINFDAKHQKAAEKFQCDPEKAYLILGGDVYAWLNIAEWFVHRKAKTILVVHQDTTPLNKSLQKKLKHLEEKCKIIVKTAEKLSPELIDHIFEVSRAKIALTMFIPNKLEIASEESIVKALCQKDTFLLTVLRSKSDALQYCQNRDNGNPTLTVLWNEPMNGRSKSFLQVFDCLLLTKNNRVVVVEENKEEKFEAADFYDALLPNSVEELLENSPPTTDVQITEITTYSVGYARSKEVTPVFVFPGLSNRSTLINRFRESLYPVFIVDLPQLHFNSLSNAVACAIPKIKYLIKDKKGPFTLLGENWGAAVALKVAKMLEITGEKVQVFLIGASPAEFVRHKWAPPAELDQLLLDRVFEKNETDKNSTWIERLSKHLANFSDKEGKKIGQVLTTIRERVQLLVNLEKNDPINGPVACISKQNTPQAALQWMSRQEVPLTVVPKTQQLLNDEVFDYIHENILIKCMH